MADLVRSADNSDKRLAQARLNLDVAEASNRTLLREVQEDRAQISRLSAQVARTVGSGGKLEALKLERDDLVQERDAAEHRARVLESKANSLTAKCCESDDIQIPPVSLGLLITLMCFSPASFSTS